MRESGGRWPVQTPEQILPGGVRPVHNLRGTPALGGLRDTLRQDAPPADAQLAGREADMVLLGILTYALFDMSTSNTFVAVFATYAMDVGVRALRTELATRNIAAKTLLDDRFLL